MPVYLDWTFLCPGCGGGAVARYRPVVEGRRVVRYEPRTAVCVSEGCEIDRRLIPLDPIAIGTPSPLQG